MSTGSKFPEIQWNDINSILKLHPNLVDLLSHCGWSNPSSLIGPERLHIPFFGANSVGKSTLLNAILNVRDLDNDGAMAKQLLGAGTGNTTGRPCLLTYSSQPRIVGAYLKPADLHSKNNIVYQCSFQPSQHSKFFRYLSKALERPKKTDQVSDEEFQANCRLWASCPVAVFYPFPGLNSTYDPSLDTKEVPFIQDSNNTSLSNWSNIICSSDGKITLIDMPGFQTDKQESDFERIFVDGSISWLQSFNTVNGLFASVFLFDLAAWQENTRVTFQYLRDKIFKDNINCFFVHNKSNYSSGFEDDIGFGDDLEDDEEEEDEEIEQTPLPDFDYNKFDLDLLQTVCISISKLCEGPEEAISLERAKSLCTPQNFCSVDAATWRSCPTHQLEWTPYADSLPRLVSKLSKWLAWRKSALMLAQIQHALFPIPIENLDVAVPSQYAIALRESFRYRFSHHWETLVKQLSSRDFETALLQHAASMKTEHDNESILGIIEYITAFMYTGLITWTRKNAVQDFENAVSMIFQELAEKLYFCISDQLGHLELDEQIFGKLKAQYGEEGNKSAARLLWKMAPSSRNIFQMTALSLSSWWNEQNIDLHWKIQVGSSFLKSLRKSLPEFRQNALEEVEQRLDQIAEQIAKQVKEWHANEMKRKEALKKDTTESVAQLRKMKTAILLITGKQDV